MATWRVTIPDQPEHERVRFEDAPTVDRVVDLQSVTAEILPCGALVFHREKLAFFLAFAPGEWRSVERVG